MCYPLVGWQHLYESVESCLLRNMSLLCFKRLLTTSYIDFSVQAELKLSLSSYSMHQHKIKVLGKHYFSTNEDVERTKTEAKNLEVSLKTWFIISNYVFLSVWLWSFAKLVYFTQCMYFITIVEIAFQKWNNAQCVHIILKLLAMVINNLLYYLDCCCCYYFNVAATINVNVCVTKRAKLNNLMQNCCCSWWLFSGVILSCEPWE